MDLVYIRNSIDNYAKYFQNLSSTRPFNGLCRKYLTENSVQINSGRLFSDIAEVEVRFDFFAPIKQVDIKTFSYSTESNALSAVERWDSRLRRIKKKGHELKSLAIYNDEVLNWPDERIEILKYEFNQIVGWSKRDSIPKLLI